MPKAAAPPKLTPLDAVKRTGKAFMALACLPSADEVGAAYSSIGARIDAIAAKAEREGSLAVALVGLRELRQTVTAQAQLAGHVGSGSAVQVNTQVNVDLGAAVKEIIAALRPPPDAAIPPELAVHLGDADVTPTRSPDWRRSSMASEAAREIARQSAVHALPVGVVPARAETRA